MIVVDASAVITILFGEASAHMLAARLAGDTDRLISVASYIEAGTVLAGRRQTDRPRAIDDLDRFLEEAGIELAPVDAAQARLALRARIIHGRGMGHGGLLNFGDCFSYALAKTLEAPLLFTGEDFAATDVTAAFAPDPG
jgi:ribonuclease VapC